jgi:hypothetical protein
LKKILSVIVALLIITLSLFILPLPLKVDKSLSGIQCRNGDTNYTEPIKINIRGMYYIYLIKDNTFKGHITLSNNEDTYINNSIMFDIHLYKDISESGMLGYAPYHKNDNLLIGWISVKRNFRELVIRLKETEGEYITAPADDRKVAVDIAVGMNIDVK